MNRLGETGHGATEVVMWWFTGCVASVEIVEVPDVPSEGVADSGGASTVLDSGGTTVQDSEGTTDSATEPAPGLPVPPALAGESTVCWTTTASEGGQLVLNVIGLDSGAVMEVDRFGAAPPGNIGFGLVEHGGRLLMHQYPEEGWYVLDWVNPGPAAVYPVDDAALMSITTWDDQILVADAHAMTAASYVDIDAVLAGTPAQQLSPLLALPGAVLAQSGTSILQVASPGAWMAELDPFTGESLRVVALEGSRDGVGGLAVAGGWVHLLDRDSVTRFDLDGAMVNEVGLPEDLQFGVGSWGLVCKAP